MSSSQGARLVGEDGTKPGRSDEWHVDPRIITVVDDPKHPLYDKRIHLPIDEGLLSSIETEGVLEPLIVMMDGDLKLLVAGRRRWKHAMELWKRQAAAKVPMAARIRVPIRLRRGTLAQAVVWMIDENEGGLADTMANRAMKAQRLLDLTGDKEFVAKKFPRINLDHLLSMLELAPPVQDAIDAGMLPMQAAPDMARIRRDDQPAKMKELMDAGLNRGALVKKAIREMAKGKKADEISKFRGLPPSRMKGIAQQIEGDKMALNDLLTAVSRHGAQKVVVGLLRYAAGEEKALQGYPELLEMIQGVDEALERAGVVTGAKKAKKPQART